MACLSLAALQDADHAANTERSTGAKAPAEPELLDKLGTARAIADVGCIDDMF